MIERASENNVNLMPGDILGSGTLGWGSLIENNFTIHRPLEPGDVVELEGIGILKILSSKKNRGYLICKQSRFFSINIKRLIREFYN